MEKVAESTSKNPM